MFNLSSELDRNLDCCITSWEVETKILKLKILSIKRRITLLKLLMQRLWLDKLSSCTANWTILEGSHVFDQQNLWNKNIDEMKESLFHKTFLDAQYPNELFPNSSILREYCTYGLLHWVPIHTCSKNNIHKGRSYEYILKIFIWLFYIFCIAWISCSFQET